MADDIDIEEHDLLDNPQIKNIFPDLSLLKQEIQNYFYEASEVNPESVSTSCSRPQDSVTNSDITSDKKLSDSLTIMRTTKLLENSEGGGPSEDISKYASNLPINFNKIILGTKPNKLEICSEKQIERLKVNNGFSKESRPNKQLEYEEFFEKQVKSDRPTVLLDDLGAYLKRSNRYCEGCRILFPNKNSLDEHRTTHYHQGISNCKVNENERKKRSNKTAPSYKCNKIQCNLCNAYFSTQSSLQRHRENIHYKDIKRNKINDIATTKRHKINSSKEHVPDTTNSCFHCKISFPTQQSLINHLYEALQPKKLSCEQCSEELCSEDKLKEHIIIHEKGKVNEKVDNVSTNDTETRTLEKGKIKSANVSKSSNIREKIRVERKEECVYIKDTKKTPKEDIKIDFKISQKTNTYTQLFNVHKKNEIKIRKEGNIAIKSTRTQKLVSAKDKKTLQNQSILINYLHYRCYICSYYLKNAKLCLSHLANKHKITKIIYSNVVGVPYDAKCKYCFLEFTDVSAYNTHLKETHCQQYNSSVKKDKQEKSKVAQQPELKTDIPELKRRKCEYNSFVLKSNLFKCNKCDVHFLSAKAAMNHIDHMEILINWKCSTCQRIFKKQDELLHIKQHSLCHKFVVFDLSALALSRVLYKCLKCAVHFTEQKIFSHYPVCELIAPESVYCKVCDILIDNEISRSHQACHQYESLKFSDFTIVESDIIPNNEIRKCRPTLPGQVKKAEAKRKSEESAKVHPSKKSKVEFDYMFDLTYCYTCKCFLTNVHKRSVHRAGRCGHLVKYVCEICGLVLTAKAYQTHKNMHKRMKNLKLQDFNFYSIGNGEQIHPPMPEYPRCNICHVYLLSKTTSRSHECSKEEYLTCNLCNLKFSDGTYKLHLLFHNYSNVNVDTEILKDNSPKIYKDDTTAENSTCDNLNQPTGSSDLLSKSFDSLDSRNDLSLAGYIFCCKNCNVAVDTYEKAIEHCQSHYNREEKQILTETCHICDLKFHSGCYNNHQKLHFLIDKETFKRFKFDTFYFISENKVWIKHVFGSEPQEVIDDIVNKSIYKYECRIKMEVIQDGPPDFTVYKCDKCRCYISGSSLFKHAENSCFKLKKHPCSFCGLPFISSISRMEHEKIHTGPYIALKSNRIVIFNREEDKAFNSALSGSFYVLYQCRNCCGIIDKTQINDHECNKNNLKKCSRCGLLIYSRDWETHDLRHTDLTNFKQNNMKIVLFGDKIDIAKVDQEELVSSFNGFVYDYTFYRCTKCQTCDKNLSYTLNHSCDFGVSRIKCPSCDLYFVTNRIKNHRKLHETDSEFVKENMKIIAFNPPVPDGSETKLQEPLPPKEQSITDSITENSIILKENPNTSSVIDSKVSENILKNTGKSSNSDIGEATAKIYKCTCGLHFLDQSSMSTHFKICNPKIRASKQKCTKCDLLFTPNILFSHLLMHHGNIKLLYKFEIIEMTKHKEFIYKCSNCLLHFVKETVVKEHFKTCNTSKSEGKKCDDCNLIFEHSSLILHKGSHKDGLREYEIIIIDEHLPNASQDNFMKQTMSRPQPDIKDTESIVLNENNLSEREPSKYSQIIYKCKDCSTHFLTKISIRRHLSEKHGVLAKLQDICNICGLNFISSTLPKHIDVHHVRLKLKPADLVVMECVENI